MTGSGTGQVRALDGRDWRLWAVTFAVIVAAVAGLNAAVILSLPGDRVFSGFLFDSVDGWSYRATANYYRHERGWAVDHPWTTERRPPAYVNLTWLVVGHLMRLGIPFRVACHLLGLLASGALLTCLLALARRLAPDRATAWCAFLLCSFGSGFGWLVYLWSPDFMGKKFRIIDLFQNDAFPVMTWWNSPHLIISWLLLAGIYLCIHKAFGGEGRHWSAVSGALALVMGFLHPFHLVTILPVLGLWWVILVIRHGRSRLPLGGHLVPLAAAALPGILYFKLILSRAPNFAHVWQARNFNPPEGALPILGGFGLILLLAPFAGLYRDNREDGRTSDTTLLLVTWTAVQLTLRMLPPFPPLTFTSRLGEGLLIPLSILAARGFLGIRRRILSLRPGPGEGSGAGGPRVPWAWILPLVAVTIPSAIFLASYQYKEITLQRATLLFTTDIKSSLSRKEVEAMAFLDSAAGKDFPLVMGSLSGSLALPGMARVRSFMGPLSSIKDADTKRRMFMIFYGPTGGPETLKWLLSFHQFDFVWWGPEDDWLGGRRPSGLPFMRAIFHNGEVTIYRVVLFESEHASPLAGGVNGGSGVAP